MSLKDRIEKAESLEKAERDKFLFEYLKLKSLECPLDEKIKFKAMASLICCPTDVNEDCLIKFLDDFENDFIINKTFNEHLFYLFIIYAF